MHSRHCASSSVRECLSGNYHDHVSFGRLEDLNISGTHFFFVSFECLLLYSFRWELNISFSQRTAIPSPGEDYPSSAPQDFQAAEKGKHIFRCCCKRQPSQADYPPCVLLLYLVFEGLKAVCICDKNPAQKSIMRGCKMSTADRCLLASWHPLSVKFLCRDPA